MQRIEYRDVIDKSEWPRGEWDNEPDKIQWSDEATGLPCLIVRNQFGALCGYVGVQKDHPLYDKHYDAPDVSVHGGLTFAGGCQPEDDPSTGICHRPDQGEPDHVYWFGFDCAHCFDVAPTLRSFASWADNPGMPKHEYRNIEYVADQCRQLAKQLKEIEHGG